MNKKILTGTLALLTFLSVGSNIAYAHGSNYPSDEIKQARLSGDFSGMKDRMMNKRMSNFDISDTQKQELMDLHKSGDMEAMHEKMLEFDIEPMSSDRFEKLTDKQKTELRELRQKGDRKTLFDKMHEFGMDFNRADISDAQRQELKSLHENGDMDAFMEKREELGLKDTMGYFGDKDMGRGQMNQDNMRNEMRGEEMGFMRGLMNSSSDGVFHRMGRFFSGLFN